MPVNGLKGMFGFIEPPITLKFITPKFLKKLNARREQPKISGMGKAVSTMYA